MYQVRPQIRVYMQIFNLLYFPLNSLLTGLHCKSFSMYVSLLTLEYEALSNVSNQEMLSTLLRQCIAAPVHCCTSALLHQCIAAPVHCCTCALLHQSIAALVHYCLQHHSFLRKLPPVFLQNSFLSFLQYVINISHPTPHKQMGSDSHENQRYFNFLCISCCL